MFRLLITALLFLLPGWTFGQTLKLPTEIVATSDVVVIQPEYDPALKVVNVKWAVLGLKKAPTFAYLEKPFVSFSKAAILLGKPAADDEVTCVVVALYEGGKLSDPAVTTIKGKPGSTTPTPTNPTNPTTPTNPPAGDRDIPASATNLHVFLVVDPANVPAEVSTLGTGANAVTQALGQRKGYWYVRNTTDSAVAPFKPSWQGKQLPVLLVVDGKTNPRKVIDAQTLELTGDAATTARRIITQIANAVGP